MAGTLQSLGNIGRDPQMANQIVQALIESTGGGAAPARMPAAKPQPGPVSSQAQLMSPEDLPYMDRLFRGEEMPFDVGGTAKPLAKAAGKVRARLTGAEGAFFDDLTRGDIKELKKLVPSVRAFGSQRDKTGRFDEVAATLEVAEKDLPGLFKYMEEMWLSETRAVGGPGTSTLPRTFSRPELLLDRFKPHVPWYE